MGFGGIKPAESVLMKTIGSIKYMLSSLYERREDIFMRRISRQVLWEGSHIRAVQIDYLDRAGVEHSWEAVERINAESVVLVVPITAAGELILIKQYRPALDRVVVELPAGLVDNGETPEKAATRELVEETGHSSENMRLLISASMSTGIHGEPWHVFVATNVRLATDHELSSHPPDSNEDIETITIPLESYRDALMEMSGEGLQIDIRIYGLVELAKAAL